MPAKMTFAVGLPFGQGRYVAPEWAISLASLSWPMNSNYCYLPVKGKPRDEARNQIVELARELNTKFLLFLDDDTAPPNFTIHKLAYVLENGDEDVGICGGIYCSKTDPPAPAVFMEEGEGPYWKWKVNDIFPCERIGTGCMMIRMSVFDKIEKPYFRDILNYEQGLRHGYPPQENKPARFEVTDDMYFCKKVREAGIKIMAHGGVLPIHWDQNGNPFFLPQDSYPVRNGKPEQEAEKTDAPSTIS
jgi:hypothetical protein